MQAVRISAERLGIAGLRDTHERPRGEPRRGRSRQDGAARAAIYGVLRPAESHHRGSHRSGISMKSRMCEIQITPPLPHDPRPLQSAPTF